MQKYFFIRTNGKFVKVDYQDILYVEGCRNYLKIITEKKSFLVLISMKRMEQLLPSHLFLRIHKSYIASLDKVTEFNRDSVCLNDKTLPIGNQYAGLLEKAVNVFSEENTYPLVAVPLTYFPKAFAG